MESLSRIRRRPMKDRGPRLQLLQVGTVPSPTSNITLHTASDDVILSLRHTASKRQTARNTIFSRCEYLANHSCINSINLVVG